MILSGGNWSWPCRLTAAFGIGGAMIALSGNCTLAQIKPDATLGAKSSSVTRNVLIKKLSSDRIDGGAKRGANLFHSFQQFNVDEGRGAYFTHPDGVKNILSRVTGKNRSNILGTLGVLGKANLFLINPNGIIFGPNARLDVNGSFVGTTANGIGLANGDSFSTNPGEPLPTGLLNVNPNAFLFNQLATRPTIQNQSRSGLNVNPGQGLLLLGGDVSSDGGILQAPGGRVELGGVADKGTVRLEIDSNNLVLSFPKDVQRADVSLTNQASVNTDGEGGGSVQIQGSDVTLTDGSLVSANTSGKESGENLSVTADTIELVGRSADGKQPSGFLAQTSGTGDAGNLIIDTRQLNIQKGARVSTSTLYKKPGAGQGGELTVTADTITLDGRSADGKEPSGLRARTLGTGAAGNLTIETKSLTIRDGAEVSASTLYKKPGAGQGGDLAVTADTITLDGRSADGEFPSALFARTLGTGDAGDLTIDTTQLNVQKGARVSTSTLYKKPGAGQGGDLAVTADTITLDGRSADGKQPSDFLAQTSGTGAAGNLTIETTGHLIVQKGARVSTSTLYKKPGAGQGGDLTVTADTITLDGRSADGEFPSALFARTEGTGDAGALTVTTGQLNVQKGARASTSTLSKEPRAGQGGDLTVTADTITLDGTGILTNGENRPSGLAAQTEGTGAAGNLTIETTGHLIVRDGAEVNASSEKSGGAAGNIDITASLIYLDEKATLNTETYEGREGNINLSSQELILRRDSSITTNANSTATGGNIDIDTDILVALENSDISADAEADFGGRIIITAQGIFGTKYRERGTSATSDITATSNLGPLFSGTVELNTPDVDPSKGVAKLPDAPVNLTVTQGCQADGGKASVEFFYTGKGGLAPDPYEPLDSPEILADVQLPAQWRSNPSGATRAATSSKTTREQIVEAQRWSTNEKGEVILVAEVPPDSSQRDCNLR